MANEVYTRFIEWLWTPEGKEGSDRRSIERQALVKFLFSFDDYELVKKPKSEEHPKQAEFIMQQRIEYLSQRLNKLIDEQAVDKGQCDDLLNTLIDKNELLAMRLQIIETTVKTHDLAIERLRDR